MYRWADTDAELTRLAAVSDEGMVSVEYINPTTGASVMPTLSCAASRLLPGRRTTPVRRTGNTILVVYRGAGTSVIEGQQFDWSAGDILVVPSWAAVEHEATEQSDLFTLGDAPVLRALGLYREQPLDAPQEVVSTFRPQQVQESTP